MSPSKWHQRSNRENPVSKIKFEKEIKRTRREKKRCHPAQEENSVTRKKTTTKNSVTSELEWRAKMGSNVGSPNGNPPPTVHQKKLINKKIIKKWKKKQTKKDKKKTRTSAKVSRPLGAALCLSLSLSLSLFAPGNFFSMWRFIYPPIRVRFLHFSRTHSQNKEKPQQCPVMPSFAQ